MEHMLVSPRANDDNEMLISPRATDDDETPLSPGQVTEMKKVFALFNKSGSKKLNVEELSVALERISGSKPSLDEVQQLMSAFDADNDGSVSWNEFHDTLSQFIKSRESGSSRFDSIDVFDKKRLHTNIADFFLNFKKNEDWQQLQQRRLQIASSIQSSLTEQEIFDQTKKNDALAKCKMMTKNLGDVTASLFQSIGSNDIQKTTECVQYIADILSILEVYDINDRLSIAEFLATLFRRIRDGNISKKIIGFLHEDNVDLQYQSARFVCLYCQGPRIPNTPKQSTLHPDNMYHKGVCINNGAVPALENLFNSNLEKLRNKAIEAVGKIASHDGKAREYVVNGGIMLKLLALIQPNTSVGTLRYLTWTLSIILGNTHSNKTANLDSNLLKTTLEKLGKLLFGIIASFRKDFESIKSNNNQNRMTNNQKRELSLVLMNCLCCLSYLIPGIKNFPIFWEKFIELISFPVASIQCMVLDCMKDIIEVDSNHLEQMLNIGLLKALYNPFSSKEVGARHKALGLLSVIVSINNGKYGEAVIKGNYMKPLLQLMSSDDLSRLTIVKIIRFITVSPKITQQLVEKNHIIRELGSALLLFKKFDPVIREVYNWIGPTYNFEFVEDIIETLNNILECGKVNNGNVFISKFDMQLLDRISDIIMKISTAKGIETWKNTSNDNSLENRLVNLLENIKFIHLRCNTKICNEVKNFVDELIFNFRKSVSQNHYKGWSLPKGWEWNQANNKNASWSEYIQNDVNQKIRIKCTVQNDSGNVLKTHVIDNVEKNETINNLQFRLSSLCGSNPVRIYYKDRQNKQIFIRGQKDFNDAVSECQFNQIELILVPINNNGNLMAPRSSIPRQNSYSDNNVIDGFAQKYGLPATQINSLWISFRSKAKNGCIDRDSFIDIMREQVGIKSNSQIEQLFNAFDYNKNGLLDFREICMGFAILQTGSPDDKIKFAFKSFDIDGNGQLGPPELFMMFKSIVTTKGIRHSSKDIDGWVKDCFNKYDLGNKGFIIFDEFKQMVHRRPLLIQAFFQFNK